MVGNIFLSKPYVICLDGYAHRHPWHGKKWQTQLKLELRYGLNIRNSSLLLAESPAAYQQIRELYPNNLVQQVPICLWEDELKSIEALWNDEGFTPLRAPTILFVGRLVRRKGVHTLLSAFGELAAHYPDWSIEIRGPAPDSAYLGELKQLVAQRGIESRVRFAPSLSGEALFRRYRSAAIFCLPSTGEGMPSAITEAMYFGGAIVAGNSGSIPYQLDNGHAGLLVNYGDVPQLRCHLESLIESRETRMSLMQAARQRMLDEFTWERHFPSVEQQFRTILDGSG
jgi:glycosyltransferase involved in cell wall biosynthesis